MTHLEVLWLVGNSVSDLSPLAGLTHLEVLDLRDNPISDLSPLVGLTSLTKLDLGENLLSYPSINTHIPAFQSRGVTVQFDMRTPTTAQISGDRQVGMPGSVLTEPLGVEVRDENEVAFAGVPVAFAVTAGGGTLSASTDTTDANGQAATTLTLGSDPGMNTVEVTVAGLEPVAIAAIGQAVPPDVPDANLAGAIRKVLGLAPGDAFTQWNMLDLTSLHAEDLQITDLTGLEHATQLRELRLNGNPISDLSPLVANTGLGDGDEVDVQENPLSYTSINTHIPALQSRGVTVQFDMRTPTTAQISGDRQVGMPGSVLTEPLGVEVQDENEVGFEGVPVAFAVTAGGGTLSASTDTTDANGQAAITLTLGSDPGMNTVEVTVAGLEPVTFTATAEATPDFDGDGETGFSDFFLFADAFGGSDPRFDLDGSGSVDFGDFFLLADHFGDSARGKLLALAREMIGLPDGPQLQQNAPNPFNSETAISWFLLRPGPARVEVFALTGQRVAVLHQGPKKAGVHRVHWDGRDDRGRPLASGVYLYRLVTNESIQARKLTLLR